MKFADMKFTDLKLAHQITLIAVALAVVILGGIVVFAGLSTSRSLTEEAERNAKVQVESLRRTADMAHQLAKTTTDSLATSFLEKFKDGLTVDPTQLFRVGGVDAPVLKLGDTAINMNFKQVDEFSDATGGVATVFAKKGDDFVRVTTSLKTEAGERAVGTFLGKEHPAYQVILSGQTYLGRAKLFGKDYMTKYVPVRAKDGSVIGILFVGFDLSETFKTLHDAITSVRFGENGYAYALSTAPGKDQGVLIVHPALKGKNLLEIADGEGKNGTFRPLVEQKSGALAYVWPNKEGVPEPKQVFFERSEPWNWVIAGGAERAEYARGGTRLAVTLGMWGAIAATGLALLLWWSIARRMRPLDHLRETVEKLAQGDDEARARLQSKDELGQLGNAFDKMMDERVATQNTIKRENEQLNNAVLNLLSAVAQLSRKDLTVKLPVTEDVTGPVADALNLLTRETGKVLAEVTNISADVTSASLKVKEQADELKAVGKAEQDKVEKTAESLAAAAETMNQIAELAKVCNAAADNAIKSTQRALQTVTNTVGGINSTRDTIRETEKRIKRLGERSQEISGVVNLINTIAERTHILALNASMHAASAGEAGRGFAVVADEVQRLAESARQATAQIANLVSNIQVETADTVTTMNAAIAQVVEGSKLAEQAGEQMQHTQASTAELVSLVQQIAGRSQEQAQVSNDLEQRASEIRKSSEQTSRKLEEAGQYTDNLVEYARSLLSAVRVFKLPA